MPTYTNSLNAVVQIGEVTFSPSEVKILYNYIDLSQDTNGYITLTSDAPYYNPLLANTRISGTDETKVYTMVSTKSSNIRLVYISGSVTIYLNSTDNLPGMTILENITLENRGKISSIHVVFVGAGEIIIQENA